MVINNDALSAVGITAWLADEIDFPLDRVALFASPFRNFHGMTKRIDLLLPGMDLHDPNDLDDIGAVADAAVEAAPRDDRSLRPATAGKAGGSAKNGGGGPSLAWWLLFFGAGLALGIWLAWTGMLPSHVEAILGDLCGPSAAVGGVSVLATASGAGVCSGHGVVYGGEAGACSCDPCWSGPRCEIASDESCPINMRDGQPHIFEAFWRERAPLMTSTPAVPVDYRVGYESVAAFSLADGGTPAKPGAARPNALQTSLARNLVALHKLAGNAAVDDETFFVFGTGARQLTAAAVWAHAQQIDGTGGAGPATLFSARPYYPFYPRIARFQPSIGAWAYDLDNATVPSGDSVVEILCWPNNPSGQAGSAQVDGGRLIHDLAYHWPHHAPEVCAGRG